MVAICSILEQKLYLTQVKHEYVKVQTIYKVA
jgi:hypothetical protein